MMENGSWKSKVNVRNRAPLIPLIKRVFLNVFGNWAREIPQLNMFSRCFKSLAVYSVVKNYII